MIRTSAFAHEFSSIIAQILSEETALSSFRKNFVDDLAPNAETTLDYCSPPQRTILRLLGISFGCSIGNAPLISLTLGLVMELFD